MLRLVVTSPSSAWSVWARCRASAASVTAAASSSSASCEYLGVFLDLAHFYICASFSCQKRENANSVKGHVQSAGHRMNYLGKYFPAVHSKFDKVCRK